MNSVWGCGMIQTMLKKPCCPKCGSRQIQFRIRHSNYVCRLCGNMFEKPNWNPDPEETKS